MKDLRVRGREREGGECEGSGVERRVRGTWDEGNRIADERPLGEIILPGQDCGLTDLLQGRFVHPQAFCDAQ